VKPQWPNLWHSSCTTGHRCLSCSDVVRLL